MVHERTISSRKGPLVLLQEARKHHWSSWCLVRVMLITLKVISTNPEGEEVICAEIINYASQVEI
jgi:hypothetical protein